MFLLNENNVTESELGRVSLTFQGQFSRFDNYAGPHVLEED